jgi:hypothetical protein
MNYKEQLQNLAQKYTQNFAPGGVVGNPRFGKKVTKQYKDENNQEVVEFEDGTRMYTDSLEYQKLYSEGLLYGESPDKITYPQAQANPEMERYKRIESMYPFKEFAQPYFEGQSGAIARATGQSIDKLENMPDDYKDRYDEWINQKWAQQVFESTPQNEDESRGEYLNRLTQGMNPQVQKALYEILPKEQQTTLWEDGGRGFGFAIEGMPGARTAEEVISQDSSLSDYEKQQKLRNLRENPTMGRIEGTAELFAPASVLPKLVQSTYRPNYSPIDALMGRKNDAGIVEDIVSDPTTYVGLGSSLNLYNNLSRASKIGDRYSEAWKILKNEAVPLVKGQAKGYISGIQKGYNTPTTIERFVEPVSELSRPDLKSLREIQSLSGLSLEPDINQVDLYTKYLKSSLNDDVLKRITGKNRAEIQENLNRMISEKKTTHSLFGEIDQWDTPPPFPSFGNSNAFNPRNFLTEDRLSSEVYYKTAQGKNKGEIVGQNARKFLLNLRKPQVNLDEFVPLKTESNQHVTSVIPSLFKGRLYPGETVQGKISEAFQGVRTGEKGYYNAADSISDSSAPLYYTNASRLGREENINFELDGFTTLNNYGFLDKAGVPKEDILKYMNNHISNLDFKGKKLPKAYLDGAGKIQIPNLLIKKFLRGGQFLKEFQQGGLIREDGTMKGKGFFGPVENEAGEHMTEFSIGANWGTGEKLIPTMVPGLTSGQLKFLRTIKHLPERGDPIGDAIANNATRYAEIREKQNQPFFATPEEEGKLPPPSYQQGGTIGLKDQLNTLAQKFQSGGCIECEQQKMQEGGKTVAEKWEEATGTSWQEAKNRNLTDGSFQQNIDLMRKLERGELSNSNRVVSPQSSNTNFDNAATFNQAFSEARKTLGSNQIFTYKGKKFGTNIEGEAFTPSVQTLSQHNMTDADTNDRLNRQNKMVGSVYSTKKTVKVEPEYKDWDRIKMRKDELNKMKQADLIREFHKNSDEEYLVLDKAKGRMHLYKGDKEITSYSVGVGENKGDEQTRTWVDKSTKKTDWDKGNKQTGAGIYTVSGRTQTNKQFSNAPSWNFFNENGIEVPMAIHATETQDRLNKIKDNDPTNNRVSNGCINGQCNNLKDLYQRGYKEGQKLYVLPDNDENKYQYKNGKLVLSSTDNKVNRTVNTLKYKPIKIYMPKDKNDVDNKFAQTLVEKKKELMQNLKIDGDTYNDIALLSLGILGQESNFGQSTKYKIKENIPGVVSSLKFITGDNSNNSKGLTQIKFDSQNSEVQKMFKKYGVTRDNLDQPDKASLATVILLSHMYNNELKGTKLLKDSKVKWQDALLYLNQGKKKELVNRTATPDKNIYIKNIKNHMNKFKLKELD